MLKLAVILKKTKKWLIYSIDKLPKLVAIYNL